MKIEDELLLLLCGKAIHKESEDIFAGYRYSNLDVDYLINTALHQGLFYFLYPELLRCEGGRLSQSEKERLKRIALQLAKRAMLKAAELVRIVETVSRQGIPIIPFKGPILAQYLYGDFCARDCGDVDFLIKPENVESVISVLEEMGYKRLFSMGEEVLAKYLQIESELQLFHPKGVVVELHWEATGRFTHLPVDVNLLQSSTIEEVFCGKKIPQFGDNHLLVYLCIHGSRHGWSKLEWLFGVACLLKNDKRISLEKTLQIAKQLGCQKLVVYSLYLACTVFKTPIPELVNTHAKAQRRILQLVDKSINSLFPLAQGGDIKRGARFAVENIILHDTAWHVIRYLIKQVFWPRMADVKYIPLPPWAFFLYYLFRPFRLVTEGVKVMLKRS